MSGNSTQTASSTSLTPSDSAKDGTGWAETNLVCCLESLIDYRGKTPKKSDQGILTLSAKSVKTGLIDYSQAYYISEETYKSFMVRGFPKKGDILMTTEAPLGCIAKLDRDDVAVAQRLLTLRGDKNILDNNYLMYYLISERGQHELLSRASGSTVSGIKRSEFENVKILLPPLLEQQAIASVLSAFDDKIELLREQNKTLEEMGQVIFQEWFGKYGVDDPAEEGARELPEGWRVGKLGEEFEIIMGQSPNGESYNENANGMIFFQGRAEFQERFPKIRLYTTEPKRIAEKFDILVSVRAPVGDINVALEKCCIGRGLAAVRNNYKSYCLYKIKSLKESFDKFEAEGTVFGSINKYSFLNIEVVIPPKNIIEKFEKIASLLDQKIYENTEQIQFLAHSRDELLPKLISGVIRVNDFSNI